MKKAFIQLHTAVFLAGFTGILGRLITLQEGWLVWYRLLFTALTLWGLYYFRGKIENISRKDIMGIFATGIIAALHWLTFYGSIKYSNVSVALVCFSSIGFFTAIVEPFITGKKWHFLELVLGILVMLGIYIIFHFDPQFKLGITLGIISSFLAAIFPILNKQFLKRMQPPTLLAYEITGGFLGLSLMLPFYFLAFPADRWIPSWSDLGWLLFLSWICSVWAFQLTARALQKVSAFTVNLTFNLEPVYGILMAFLLYQENKMLHPAFYIGLFLIITAVVIQTLRIYYTSRRTATPVNS